MNRFAQLIGLFITLSLASTAWSASYVGNSKIDKMQSAYGGWLIWLESGNANPDGCTSQTVLLQGSHHQYEELYSFLLTAYAAEKPVNIAVQGCHTSGAKLFQFVYTDW